MTKANPARRVVLFVFFTVFLDLVGFGIIIPFLPLYVKSMGASAETVGFILACFSATQLVATPFLGRLSDRVGRRRVIVLSLAGNALAMVLFALATKMSLLWLLFASRIMAGATAGNLAACQAAIADVTTREERAEGMGQIGAGIGLGMMVGPVLGGMMSQLGAWAPPLAAAALALTDLIGVFFLMPETNLTRAAAASSDKDGDRASLAHAIVQPALLLVFALYFLTFLYMTNLQVSLALLTNARLKWTEHDIGLVFGMFGTIMFVIQKQLIGPLSRAFGARALVVAGSISSMCGLALIAYATVAAPLIVGLVLLGAGLGVINPCLATIASDNAEAGQRGAILGFAQSAGGLARTVGPILSGVLYARVAPAAPFVGGAVAALVSTALGVSLLAMRPARA